MQKYNIKSLIVNYKIRFLDEKDALDKLMKFEKLLVKNNIIYHNSFDRYCSGSVSSSFNKLFMFCFYWFLSLLLMVSMGYLVKYNDIETQKLFGSPVLLNDDMKKITYRYKH